MAYDKTIWNETIAIIPERLQKQEDGIAQVTNEVDIAMTQFQADFNNAITQAEQNVVNGKTLISNAINTKRVVTTPDMTFQQLADKTGEINLNRRVASGSVSNNPSANLIVTGLSFRPTNVIITNSYLNYPFFYVRRMSLQDGSGLSHQAVVSSYQLNYNYTPTRVDGFSGFVLDEGIRVTDDGFYVNNAFLAGTGRSLQWVAYE